MKIPEEKKKRTVSFMKEKRTVPDEVKAISKQYMKFRKTIESTLQSGPKTIPQIAKESGLPLDVTMYYVMSLQKFGRIAAGDVDDDEYYFYELAKK
jgi:predicted Rossmann fold nucleotide-binding protein DprA/Smf involved in DNA uptake